MYSVITTAVSHGLSAVPVKVEADVSDGLPCFEMVGFLASEVKEARERVRAALKNTGFPIPAKHITVNLTPANIRKSGTGCDLPVAAALLCALGILDPEKLSGCIMVGEIGLNGQILPVNGILSAAILAKEKGAEIMIVSEANAREAAIIPDIRVIPVSDLTSFVRFCTEGFPEPYSPVEEEDLWATDYGVDFSDICGQPLLRRACEIAVSGMHNLLMIGPPGSGKTMTARRIPTILPELTREEKLELSQIYSIAGLLDEKRIIKNERPFRSPHHTATPAAIAGGGRIPRPGEISLAHHGVLFLDELPEFSPQTLEVLREPLEEKQIHLSRLDAGITYPADFLLVAAMNPCPCGYYPDRNRCSCSSFHIRQYINHVSQALLDRIDLCVETKEITFADMQPCGANAAPESSAALRKRVEHVHSVQRIRFAGKHYHFNSQIPNSDLSEYCSPDKESIERMEDKFKEYSLSARTYNQVLKTARTIADMDGEERIRWKHIEEAFCFRGPNKKYWR